MAPTSPWCPAALGRCPAQAGAPAPSLGQKSSMLMHRNSICKAEICVPPPLPHTQRDQRVAGFPLAPLGTMSVRLPLSKSSPDSSPVSQGSWAPLGTREMPAISLLRVLFMVIRETQGGLGALRMSSGQPKHVGMDALPRGSDGHAGGHAARQQPCARNNAGSSLAAATQRSSEGGCSLEREETSILLSGRRDRNLELEEEGPGSCCSAGEINIMHTERGPRGARAACGDPARGLCCWLLLVGLAWGWCAAHSRGRNPAGFWC